MDGFIKCSLVYDGHGRELVSLPSGVDVYPPLKVDHSFLIHTTAHKYVFMQVFILESVENLVRVSIPSASLGIDSKIWIPKELVEPIGAV